MDIKTMEAEDSEDLLEEGELSDDSDTYTPLERPVNYSTTITNPRFQQIVESESELEQSSDTDSSDASEKCKKPKKLKIKLKPQNKITKKKKYDIWSTRCQEDVLAETLNSCDVTKKDRSRNVESYDYLGNHFYSGNNSRSNNKRTRDDRNNKNFMSLGRKFEEGETEPKGNSRTILDLGIDVNNSSLENIARDMANKLCEEREDLILKVLTALGTDKTLALFKETQLIESKGGMLIMNQTRRRTPGGVFLLLVRQNDEITQEQVNVIFGDDRLKKKAILKSKKKEKLTKLKRQIVAEKSKSLPTLLTRAELLAESNRSRKETHERDVINPPPTPETDGHDNSGDGMEGEEVNERKISSYDEDFLDLGCTATDMDLF